MATMMIQLSNDCWSRWGAVIRKLAEKYNFPASNQDEMNIFLRIFAGNGSTFRLTSEPWKFIMDVTRRGNVIDDIIAITVMAKVMEDPRRNGKAKSYEQQVLSLNDEIRSRNPRFPTRNDLSQQIITLDQLVEEKSGELAKSKESRKKWKNLAVERREKVSSLQNDIDELQDQVTTSEEMKTTTFMQELDALKQKEAHFEKEKEAFWKEKEDFDKEKRSFELERRNPSTTPRNPRSRNNATETRLRNLTRFNEELEKERTSNKQSIQVLQDINNGLRDRIKHLEDQKAQADTESRMQMKEMGDELTNLQRNIEGLELERKKHIETHQAEVQELTVTNARIHNSRRSVDHYVYNLDVRVKRMEVQAKQDSDLITKLEAENQIQKDQVTRAEEAQRRAQKEFQNMVSRHMDQIAGLKHQIRDKDESLRRSQNDLMNARATVVNLQRENETRHQMSPTQSHPVISQSDLETQQKLRREADERITDLQSKLNATELEVRAKTTEIAALGRKCADRTAALDYQEKKCFDYASKLATMRSELEAAKSRAEGAEERCAVEVAGLKEDAEASKDRVHELEMECAGKAAAANDMEKRCRDKEAWRSSSSSSEAQWKELCTKSRSTEESDVAQR
ncbi:hypothetical protein CMUS01_11577 [Colletotrichum musicola]|uniref:Uncharacterized protein n=1 Tax=Colletotrichum musicola TaxID=2175873 RepID=A0A8H6JVT4_9PEZI|nr:hypothetical protein CMUS01_11577 [Colletotrichum musicola]